jgi:hypothetical protein
MPKQTPAQRQQLREANAKLKTLQGELAEAKKREGIDDNIAVKVRKNQARYERSHAVGAPKVGVGKFFMMLEVTAKKQEVYIPLSMASGKKVAGFMYQIEGTGEAAIAGTEIDVQGDGVTQVTIGTLLFAKIPAGVTAVFRLQITTRGHAGKTYSITISRINYKLALSDARYLQYLKPLPSERVKFS